MLIILLKNCLLPVTATSDNDGQEATPYQAPRWRGAHWYSIGQRAVLAQPKPGNSQVHAIKTMRKQTEALQFCKVKNATFVNKRLVK